MSTLNPPSAKPPTSRAPPSAQPRNPAPLSALQEAAVREVYHRRVRETCADEIQAFAQCAVGRTFTATWKCRTQRIAMNGCMIAHATPEEHDAARAEWFGQKEARKVDREEERRREAEAKRLKEEWWREYRERREGAR